MILRDNYTKTATVKRSVESTSGGNVKKEFEVIAENVAGHLQPASSEITQDIQASFGKNWVWFCDPTDIKEGDRMIIDEKEYRVTGVESYEWKSRKKHMEVLMRKW